jgi:hypothetical protein
MKTMKDGFVLSNGVKIPCVGYGTWLTTNEQASDAVQAALAAGYRHIDTAAKYENEQGVGDGIRRSGLAREEIFHGKLYESSYISVCAADGNHFLKTGHIEYFIYILRDVDDLHFVIRKTHADHYKAPEAGRRNNLHIGKVKDQLLILIDGTEFFLKLGRRFGIDLSRHGCGRHLMIC